MIWNFPSIARAAILMLLPILATGCGWFGGNKSDERDPNDYLQAQPEADLAGARRFTVKTKSRPLSGAADCAANQSIFLSQETAVARCDVCQRQP